MSYRDDRDALRQRAETAERELEATRRELAEARRPVAAGTPKGEVVRPQVSPLLGMAAFALLVVVLFSPLAGPIKIGVIVPSLLFCGMAASLRNALVAARPAQALVLAGRSRRNVEGTQVGFRTVVAGRALRIPVIEQASILDLGVFRVPLTLRSLTVRDGRSVTLDLVAHASIVSESVDLDRAIERLLRGDANERRRIVSEAVERALHLVASEIDSATLLRERARVADRALSEAREDLSAIGIGLSSLFVVRLEQENG
jgi:uncharacterized membrane protein YqiK